jgi:HIV Tat-specific factor 1
LDIKDDVREECAKLGEVTNVVLFDKEVDGVASVRFADADAAKACVRLMDGRYFSGTRVEAYIADGTEKFRKSSERKADVHEEGDDEGQRLDKFGSWLEGDGV